MANYTDTSVQMYRIVGGQEKSQTGSGNSSSQYVEKAKKVIELERQVIKASNDTVSPIMYEKPAGEKLLDDSSGEFEFQALVLS